MTVFGSHGRARSDEFAAGDVGYVPQGYGHYIENSGARTSNSCSSSMPGATNRFAHRLDGGQSAAPAGHQFRRAGSHLRGFPDRRVRFMPG